MKKDIFVWLVLRLENVRIIPFLRFFFTLSFKSSVSEKLKYSFIVLVLQQIFVLTINDVLVWSHKLIKTYLRLKGVKKSIVEEIRR